MKSWFPGLALSLALCGCAAPRAGSAAGTPAAPPAPAPPVVSSAALDRACQALEAARASYTKLYQELEACMAESAAKDSSRAALNPELAKVREDLDAATKEIQELKAQLARPKP